MPWGSRHAEFTRAYRIDPFEQRWFPGNHADIGGGYPENESRLSDIALEWMLGEATNSTLADEKLIIDRTVLRVDGRIDGMQHDETRSSIFRWAKKTLRDPVRDATLHRSVLARFALSGVQQYDINAPYRPEALRYHQQVTHYYADVPLPHTTCWQRIELVRDRIRRLIVELLDGWLSRAVSRIYPANWKEGTMRSEPERRQLTPDSVVSCLGLLLGVLLVGVAVGILFVWQMIPWLHEGVWQSYPLAALYSPVTSWVGLQIIINWIFALPITLVLALFGIFLFWMFGLLSSKLYQAASRETGKTITPAQSRA